MVGGAPNTIRGAKTEAIKNLKEVLKYGDICAE